MPLVRPVHLHDLFVPSTRRGHDPAIPVVPYDAALTTSVDPAHSHPLRLNDEFQKPPQLAPRRQRWQQHQPLPPQQQDQAQNMRSQPLPPHQPQSPQHQHQPDAMRSQQLQQQPEPAVPAARAASQIQSVRDLRHFSRRREERDEKIASLMRECYVEAQPNLAASGTAGAFVYATPPPKVARAKKGARIVYVKRPYNPVAGDASSLSATMPCSVQSAAIGLPRAGLIQAW